MKRVIWLGIAACMAVLMLYGLWVVAHVYYWADYNPSTTAFMQARLKELRAADPDFTLEHSWVPYRRISPHLKRALVAAEDAKFLQHEGFDWDGIQDAVGRNLRKGRIVAGGSTITQQLAKNLFLSSERTAWRKLQEAFIAIVLESILSKRRIFEIYLNVIEWGNGVFGVEAACRRYYGTSAGNLTPEQAAWLAAMVPNPRYYETRQSSPALQRKTEIIQARMPYARVP